MISLRVHSPRDHSPSSIALMPMFSFSPFTSIPYPPETLYSPSSHSTISNSISSNPSFSRTARMRQENSLSWRSCPVYCRMFISGPGFDPLGASNTLGPSRDNPKCLLILPNVFWGRWRVGQRHSGWALLLWSSVFIYLFLFLISTSSLVLLVILVCGLHIG